MRGNLRGKKLKERWQKTDSNVLVDEAHYATVGRAEEKWRHLVCLGEQTEGQFGLVWCGGGTRPQVFCLQLNGEGLLGLLDINKALSTYPALVA